MLSENVTGDTAGLIADLTAKYVWWRPIGRASHPIERVIAQIMNVGTYEDIRRLEGALGEDRLLSVMRDAEPGTRALPRTPPMRAFRRAGPL